MIGAIKQINYTTPHAAGFSGSKHSPENFTGSPTETVKFLLKNKKTEMLLCGTLLWILMFKTEAITIPVSKKFRQEFSEIYDKAWEDIDKDSKQSQIKINKPKLQFYYDMKAKTSASYFVNTNAVRINLYVFNNYDYMAYKDKEIFSKGHFPFFKLKEIEKLKKKGVIDDSWTIQKVNRAEKMFYWNYTLAHELRHCEQFHLMLNDPKVGKEFVLNDSVIKVNKSNPFLPEPLAKMLVKIRSPYLRKFEPGENIDKSNLKIHTVYKDKQFDFTAEDFEQSQSKYFSKNASKNPDNYFLNLLEIDANNFATKYTKSQKEIESGCRENIKKLIIGIQTKDNLEKFDEFIDQKVNAA